MRDNTLGPGCVIVLIPLVVFALLIPSMFVSCGAGYSEGERTGLLVKFSQKGIIWKTWEGELNLGGIRPGGDGDAVANVWAFSVEDPSVIRRLEKALREGKVITLRYTQFLNLAHSRGETEYLITDVLEVNGR